MNSKGIEGLSKLLLIVTGVLLYSTNADAQIRTDGTPKSETRSLEGEIPTRQLSEINVEALMQEDEQDRMQNRPIPPRFGYAHKVNYGLENSGSWSETKDGREWRLRLESPGAFSINLIFSHFFMPDSASLFVYNDDRSEVLGAFTTRNNKPYGKFSIQPISGSAVTLEYFEPKEARGEGKLTLSHVIHAYKPLFNKKAVHEKDLAIPEPAM